MLASDLQRLELIGIDEKTGFPLFGASRFVVFGMAALARMQNDLIRSLGWDKASIIHTRYGYELGMGVAIRVTELYHFDTPEELLKAGCVLQTMMGLATASFTEIRIDLEKKSLSFSGSWMDSFESTLWSSQFERSVHPVCCIVKGMLSGYASAVMGVEVLVREIGCQAEGKECCTFEGKTLAEWGLDPEETRRILSVDPIDEELARLQRELGQAREDLARQNTEIKMLKTLTYRTEPDRGIVCRSEAMNRLLITAEKVAATRSTVLIQGESGTGKEVLARFIHRCSGGMHKPFLAVNCAALPPNLLESELFGHVKGAFTGANSDKRGLFVEAGEGTLFLDEVGEIPLEMQAKILRALQEKEVRQVGGLKEIPVQARIIAATNRDLREMVASGRFREDLYYRLAVFPLLVPPLRERREDILLLARNFLARIKADHPGFAPKAVRQMEAYAWPGNVRELENWVEYAVVMSGGDRILPDHFPQAATTSPRDPLAALAADLPALDELERRYTRHVLEHTAGNRTEAARLLGIGISTLWRHLKEKPAT
ncbi:MAG: sigma-54-dependent Fis family transcriptional regulator [Deltaproteobacteria bacterium]|nr:sigma-54-dependent Fis family transcriptional regulator [Deltaproteobacteria bacterium]